MFIAMLIAVYQAAAAALCGAFATAPAPWRRTAMPPAPTPGASARNELSDAQLQRLLRLALGRPAPPAERVRAVLALWPRAAAPMPRGPA